MKNKIVAIVGMCGSGKSVVTEMFCADGFDKVYFGQLTIDELNAKNMPVNEQNEKMIREHLRSTLGQGAFAIKLYDKILDKSLRSPVILDGLYSWSEYKYLKEKLGDQLVVLAIVTNSSVRYNRLANRQIRPLNTSNAIARDYAEIENIEKGGPIAIADYYIVNNGNIDQTKAQYLEFIKTL